MLKDHDGWVTRQATGYFGADSYWATHCDELLVVLTIFTIATVVTWSYDRGGWGVRLYETMLKIVVAGPHRALLLRRDRQADLCRRPSPGLVKNFRRLCARLRPLLPSLQHLRAPVGSRAGRGRPR